MQCDAEASDGSQGVKAEQVQHCQLALVLLSLIRVVLLLDFSYVFGGEAVVGDSVDGGHSLQAQQG